MNDAESSKGTEKTPHVDNKQGLPPGFGDAVLRPSQALPEGVSVEVRGYDFNRGVDYEALLASYASTGFQATHFARAVDVLNSVVLPFLLLSLHTQFICFQWRVVAAAVIYCF